jgi:thiol-disulfide isomerase/thioredoxin
MTACTEKQARHADPGSDAVGLTVFTSSEGVRVPRLAGTTLTGQRLDASSYAAGSPLVINVWASWCSPCREELPLLARAARHGIRVLGIDERDSTGRAVSFAHGEGITYPSLQDPDGRLLASLRLLPRTGIPSTLFVTASGRAQARVVGPLDRETLRRALRMAAS